MMRALLQFVVLDEVQFLAVDSKQELLHSYPVLVSACRGGGLESWCVLYDNWLVAFASI